MSLIEKFKFLMQLNKMIKEIQMLDKMKGMLGHMDGLKSTMGLLMVVAYYALPQYTHIHVPDMVLNMGAGMAGLGLAHKLEKGTALLTKGLDILTKVLQIMKATLEALNKKQGESK